VPTMLAWIEQWYLKVPGLAKVKENALPLGSEPLSNEPSSAVTVWVVVSSLVQVTFCPALTLIVSGWNAKQLGGLPGQPGQDRREHPSASPRTGHRRGARGVRAAAGPGRVRDLRTQARRLLPGPSQGHPGLLLHRIRAVGRGPGHPSPAGRRAGHRRRGRRRVPGRAHPAALDACLQAADQLEAGHDAALVQYRREVERARYEAPGPNAATGPSTPTTAWSPAAWRPTGRKP
jgi:hypothetical protein